MISQTNPLPNSRTEPPAETGTLLRIFVGKLARYGRRPAYETIVLKAREMHLRGATVLQGAYGFGRSSKLHSHHALRIGDDVPVIIEIVDRSDRISSFLPVLNEIMPSGIATLEDIRIFPRHKHAG